MGGLGRHHPDLLALLQDPVLDPDQNHDAEIGIVPAVDQHHFQWCIAVTNGRGQTGDNGFQQFIDAHARFR